MRQRDITMNKDLLPNFTKIPNLILDQIMPELSKAELKILLCICRKTYGWQKERDRISRSQFKEMTKLGKNNIEVALKSLKEMGIITKTESANKYDIACYEINLNYQENLPPKMGDTPKTGQNLPPKTGDNKPENYPPKQGITKETNINKEKENSPAPIYTEIRRGLSDKERQERDQVLDTVREVFGVAK
jgi:phage replication O-like protein O